jgi:hypothetical protein
MSSVRSTTAVLAFGLFVSAIGWTLPVTEAAAAQPISVEPKMPASSAPAKSSVGAAASSANVDAEEFRRRFPEPPKSAEAIAAFRSANRWIEAHAKHGASAYVSLFYADGSTGYGRDYFFSGRHPRFKEIRRDYLIFSDLRGGCSLEGTSRRWTCDSEWTPYIGIPEIIPETIIDWGHRSARCDAGECAVYRITVARWQRVGQRLDVTADPKNNHTTYSVFLRRNGEPVMYTEQELVEGKRRGPDTSYVFDFRSHVRNFGLPRLP